MGADQLAGPNLPDSDENLTKVLLPPFLTFLSIKI
jgi:hypothetical protein